MPRNLLPRLRQSPKPANVPPATKAEWTAVQSPAELGSLDLGGPPSDDVRQRVQSIPNPWARMLLFREAMGDPHHPARRLVENELLDAFQYLWSSAERPSVRFETVTVRVDEIARMARTAGTERVEWLQRALVDLRPGRDGAGGPAFDAITIVTANGRPVLATSPYTLLFTAEDAADLPESEKGSFFRYARGGEARSLDRRPLAFQRYVAQVLLPQVEALDPSAHDNTDGQAVLNLVGGWLRQQVEHARTARTDDQLDATQSWQVAANALDPIKGIVGRVVWHARGEGAGMEESLWRLRPGRAGAPKPVVIDAPQFDGRYVPDALAVPLPPDFADLPRTKLPGTATSYPWVSPYHDWLADRVLVLAEPLRVGGASGAGRAGDGAAHDAAHDAVYGYVRAREGNRWRGFASSFGGPAPHLQRPQIALPLKREILRYFTPAEIERMLEIEVQANGKVLVTLHVPVGPTGEKSVSREYDRPDETKPRGPELVLWPGFRSAQWRDYLLFQQDPAGLSSLRPAVIEGWSGDRLDLVDERNPLGQERQQRGEAVYVTAFDGAPEAFEFTEPQSGGGEPARLGLVLPRYEEATATTDRHWQVGVDFGTSNTVLGVNAGDRQGILSANDLTLALTEARAATRGEQDRLARNIDAYFFPPALAPAPFGTAVVRQRHLPTFNVEEERLGLRVNVPFSGFVENDTRNRVTGDLKWSDAKESDAPGGASNGQGSLEQEFLVKSFLRHTLAVVFAEAAREGVKPANVAITYSYPRAFTQPQRSNLGKLWGSVHAWFVRRLGARAGAVAQGPDESGAVLHYFYNAGILSKAGDVNVVIDVGGGTADVAMYGRNATLALDSVMLGGRNLTGARLRAGDSAQRENPFVARFVAWSEQHHLVDYRDEWGAVQKYRADQQDHLAFGYLLRSTWFEKHGGDFSKNAAFHAFQGVVLYFYGALFYYVGLSLRGIAAQRGEEVRTLVPSRIILAGNGSKYVDWLTGLVAVTPGTLAVFAPFAQMLSRLLVAGMGLGADVRGPEVQVTPRPKLEVALGLVAEVKPSDLNEGGAERSPAVGERVRAAVGTGHELRAFDPTSRLAADEVFNPGSVASSMWVDGELEIERFHAAFQSAFRPLVEPGSPWITTGRRVGTLLGAFDRSEIKEHTVRLVDYLATRNGGFHGSVFLAEATTVLERMLDDWFVAPGASAGSP